MSFAVIPSDEISCREDFALLCNARGVTDAVEVGTDHGAFARRFMERFEGNWLICLDPWDAVDEFPFDREPDMIAAVQALAPWHGRVRFVRGRSPEAIPFLLSQYSRIGFVYIDGDHSEPAVAADLAAWWEVLPEGGILAGHDFDADHPGVVAAVTRFARDRGLVVRTTLEGDSPPSWYLYRVEPPTLMHRFFRHGESPNPHAPPGT